jgi:ABC-type Fe3+/spermidine/putrescine transport system ATPase subunit
MPAWRVAIENPTLVHPSGTQIARRNLDFDYLSPAGEAIAAFRCVDLDIRRHDFISLLGASGCGKSTLLYIIGGFLQASPGVVMVDGVQARKASADRGIVFQSFELFYWKAVRKKSTASNAETADSVLFDDVVGRIGLRVALRRQSIMRCNARAQRRTTLETPDINRHFSIAPMMNGSRRAKVFLYCSDL